MPPQPALEPVEEQGPVGKVGDRVVQRLMGEPPLGGAAPGEVVHLGDEVRGRVLDHAGRRHRELDGDAASVTAQAPRLQAGEAVGPGPGPPSPPGGAVRGGEDGGDAGPDEVRLGAAEQRAERAVHADDPPLAVGDEARDRGVLERPAQQLLSDQVLAEEEELAPRHPQFRRHHDETTVASGSAGAGEVG